MLTSKDAFISTRDAFKDKDIVTRDGLTFVAIVNEVISKLKDMTRTPHEISYLIEFGGYLFLDDIDPYDIIDQLLHRVIDDDNIKLIKLYNPLFISMYGHKDVEYCSHGLADAFGCEACYQTNEKLLTMMQEDV